MNIYVNILRKQTWVLTHLLLLLGIMFTPRVSRAQFTTGNLVVLEVGPGLNSDAEPLQLIEYTTGGVATGFTVSLPQNVAGSQITTSGSASSEGQISLSAEKDRIIVPGYDATTGTLSIAGTTATANNREDYAVSSIGTATKLAASTSVFSGNNIRSATASGTNYYATGANTGVVLMNNSGVVSSTVTNNRQVAIYNGQLYFSTGSGTNRGIYQVGTGIPTATGQTSTVFVNTGGSSSNYGFAISPDALTVYIADDASGISKWTRANVASSFTQAYVLNSTNSRGLTADFTASPYVVYATTITNPNAIIKITDNGAGSSATTLVTAPSNYAFRGIVFAPVECLTLTPTVTNVSCNGGSNGAINLGVTGSYTPTSYSWTGPAFTASTQNISGLSAGTYTVIVTATGGCTDKKTVTVTQPTALSATTTQTNISCYGGANGSAGVSVSGGTPSYTYSWAPSGGTGATASGLSAGTYTCTITDAKNCILTKTFTLTQPTVLSATTSQTNVACNGGNNGSATVTVSGGTPSYTYSWAPSGGNAATASNLVAGNYTCTITDANNCVLTKTFTITQSASLTATTSQTNVNCNGGNNGTATVAVSGGTPSYSYSWAPSGGNGATATALAAGNYTCTITDANSCAITRTFTITQPAALSAAASQTNVSCNGGSNGTATVSVSGGTPSYTYAWTPSGGNAATATGLPAGNYTCTVTDANSCVLTQAFTITSPAALSATTSQTNVSCNGGNNGSATVNVSGGTPSYTYSWAPSGGTGATASSLIAGNYTCTVTDANSCVLTQVFTITSPTALSAATSQTNVSCNGGNNGSATVTVSGGTPSYTYSWAPSGGNAATATGLAAGTYTCTITDANNCTLTKTFTITQPTSVTATTSQTNVSCFGGSNGTATVNPSGGTPSYTYSWSPAGGTGATATGLAAGSYTCTITDANLCVITKTFTITQPLAGLSATTSQTDVSCNGGNNGSATVTVSGGTPSYTYAWSPTGGNAATANSLAAGTYTCTITDANNCTLLKIFTITQPVAGLSATTSQANVSCNGGGNGSATVVVSGGTPSYTYSWAPSGGIGATATGLTAGTYSCTITDAGNCNLLEVFTITQPAALSAAVSQSDVSCNGGNNGSATVAVSGGVPSYTYSWAPSGGTGATASGLSAATYTCTISDANNCLLTKIFNITEPNSLTATTSQTDVSCNGNSTGTATVTVSGGTPSYTYSWVPSGGTSATANGLLAGSYTCTITDAHSCMLTRLFTITQPTALSAITSQTNVGCYGAATGSATVSASGGTPNYTYSWAPPRGNAATANNLLAGTYTCTVTDANMCSIVKVITITQPLAGMTATTSQANVSCNGGSNGTASVTPSGGTPSYNYLWAPVGGAAPVATGLAAGNYTCTISDASGCSIDKIFTITEPPALTATTSKTDASCNGSTDATATVNVSGGTPSYTYAWSPAGGNASTANYLAAGSYTCTITDANNCILSKTFAITEPSLLVASVAGSTAICAGSTTVLSFAGSPNCTITYTANAVSQTVVTGASGTATVAVSPSVNTTYTLQSIHSNTGPCGNVVSGSVIVTVNPIPAAPDVQDTAYCKGDNAVGLTATGQSLLWYTTPTGGTGLPTAPVPSTGTAATLSWYVSQTVLGCESPRAQQDVLIRPIPLPPTASPSSYAYCQFDTASILSAAGDSLKWYAGPTGGPASVTAPTPSTNTAGLFNFYVSQTQIGCESPRLAIPVTVTVKPQPPVVQELEYCQFDTAAALTANGQDLLWYTDATGGGSSSVAPVPSTMVPGIYTWYVSQAINNCRSDRAAVHVTIYYRPVPTVTVADTLVCSGKTANLSYSGPVINNGTYNWVLPAGASIVNGSGQGPLEVKFTVPGINTVTLIVATDSGRCTGVATADINVMAAPEATIDIAPAVCVGDALTVSSINASPDIADYKWDFAGAEIVEGTPGSAGTYRIKWQSPGSYTISLYALSKLQCPSDTGFRTIEVHPLPDASIQQPSVAAPCAGDTLLMAAQHFDSKSKYYWSPAQFFDDGEQGPSTRGIIEFTANVKLTVYNEYGCTASDSVLINTQPCCDLYMPDAFSPNGDGKNDLFRPITQGHHKIYIFRIVNRWGEVVFNAADEHSGWNGAYNGQGQEAGTYSYYIRYECSPGKILEKTGDVVLIR
ncbi:MAG: gliding motility-associated C-terminal domain-containing protein [Bacteroidetes bacterium]|nr:gliding motility-associated C-terminal domain-containing protein [Bacteroidota bacterium]